MRQHGYVDNGPVWRYDRPMLNKDFILNEWLPALRSGKYQQGQGSLRTRENKYCCLGVACDLYAKKFHKRWFMVKLDGVPWRYALLGDGAMPRSPIEDFIGMDFGQSLPFQRQDMDLSLPEANDDQDLSFSEIADAIEAWVQGQP